jgi:hypothetical protein
MCWQSTDAQHIRFESAVGSHPQPLAPAALASASRAQHALALRGAGPPQHESVFCSLPASVSVIAALDIVIPLIEVSTRRSPANDEDAGRRKGRNDYLSGFERQVRFAADAASHAPGDRR